MKSGIGYSETLDNLDNLVPYLVGKGAMLLDEHGPQGWRGMIDRPLLNMGCPDRCALGQVYREPFRAARQAHDEAGTGYHVWTSYGYGIRALLKASGVNGEEELLTLDDLAHSHGFMECHPTQAVAMSEAHGFISYARLTEAWLDELSV